MPNLLKSNNIYHLESNGKENYIDASNDLKKAISENKLTKVKKCIKQWCDYCTWSGINNMIRTEKKSVFVIWLLLYLASLTYCLFNITNLTIDFFKYDALINMKFETQMPTDFPAVTGIRI